MRRAALALALAAAPALAQPPVGYRLAVPHPASHRLEVTVTVPAELGCPELAMAVWTPGGYVLSWHAAKVVTASFASLDGVSLAATRPDLDRWRPACGDASGYAARLVLEVRSPREPYSAHVDDRLLFANLVTVLPYLPEHRDVPARLELVLPEGWRAVSDLPVGADGAWTTPDWDRLADGMVAAAPGLAVRKVDLDGTELDVAFTEPPGDAVDLERLDDVHRRLVEAAGRTFGGIPFGRYLFLYKVGPEGSHGGLEHAHGTAMGIPRSALASTRAFLDRMGLPAHELVHAWNVKRARPRQLRPYDYARVQRTELLWVAEGWTSYYGPLLLVRAGIRTPERFYRTLSERISAHRANPTNRYRSLEAVSLDSWLRPTAPFLTFRTYYTKGSLAALDLDLAIRKASGGRHTLDELVRTLLHDPDLARSGYTTQDLVFLAGRLAGHPMDGWFRRAAGEPGYLDLAPALASVGLRLEPDPEGPRAWSGLRLAPAPEERGARVRWVEPGSPAEAAGLGAGDLLLAVDGRTGELPDLRKALARLQPGATARLAVVRGDRLLEVELRPAAWEPLRAPVRVREDPEAPPEAVAARRAWLWLDGPEAAASR